MKHIQSKQRGIPHHFIVPSRSQCSDFWHKQAGREAFLVCKIALLGSWKLGHVEIIDVMVFPVTSRYTVCTFTWTFDIHCLIKQVPWWLQSWGEPGITEYITYQYYKPSVVWSPEPLTSLPLWKFIAYGSLRTLILIDLGNIFMSAYFF